MSQVTTEKSGNGKKSSSSGSSQSTDAQPSSGELPLELLGLFDVRLFGMYFFWSLAGLTGLRFLAALAGVLSTLPGGVLRTLTDPFVYPLNHFLHVSPASRLEAGSLLALTLYAVAAIGIRGIPAIWTLVKVREEQAG